MSELQGIARFKFHEGKLEEFKRLSAQAMEIVRTKDTGTSGPRRERNFVLEPDMPYLTVKRKVSDRRGLRSSRPGVLGTGRTRWSQG